MDSLPDTVVSAAAAGIRHRGVDIGVGRIGASLEQGEGYSSIAAGLALGMPLGAARIAAMFLTALLVIGIFIVARGEDGDRRSFSLAIVTGLVSTPIVWSHYFVLLLEPIALARPRLSARVRWTSMASASTGSPLTRICIYTRSAGLKSVRW